MASLTPGVLSKLIKNAGNEEFKVTGEHRSPLLQVLEIVPSLPGAGDDQYDPWQSRGFFLKVSDSLHSAYASISDEDLDLIFSDKIQLGQFVYVSRLDLSPSGSSVPVLRGLKPIPNRRPCVGNPTDLVSSDALPIGRGVAVGFTRRPIKAKTQHKSKIVALNNQDKPRKMEPSRNFDKSLNKKLVESRRLSLDSARRGWGHASSPVSQAQLTPNHTASPGKVVKKVSSSSTSSESSLISKVSPLKNKTESLSSKLKEKVLRKDVKSPTGEAAAATTTHLIQMPLGSEKKISWRGLPSNIAVLGKKAVENRNLSCMAAAHALEEASAADSIINCMCSFSELTESSQRVSVGVMTEKFLQLYQRTQKSQTTLNSLLKKTPSESNLSSNHEIATSWVQAAIATNLSRFKLFRTKDEFETQTSERNLYIVIENNKKKPSFETEFSKETKPNPKIHGHRPSDSSGTNCSKKEEWSKGKGIEEAAKLADKLLLVSGQWFVRYLDDVLSNNFELSRGEQGSEIAHLLMQLKRVNKWMDELIGSGIEIDVNDQMEQLRKKLYKVLLKHVDIAARSSE